MSALACRSLLSAACIGGVYVPHKGLLLTIVVHQDIPF